MRLRTRRARFVRFCTRRSVIGIGSWIEHSGKPGGCGRTGRECALQPVWVGARIGPRRDRETEERIENGTHAKSDHGGIARGIDRVRGQRSGRIESDDRGGGCRSAGEEVGTGTARVQASACQAEFRIEFGITQVLRIEFPIEREQQQQGDASLVVVAIVRCEPIRFGFTQRIAKSFQRKGEAQVAAGDEAQVASRVTPSITTRSSTKVPAQVSTKDSSERETQVAPEHPASPEHATQESSRTRQYAADQVATDAGASELVEPFACDAEPCAGSGEDNASPAPSDKHDNDTRDQVHPSSLKRGDAR